MKHFFNRVLQFIDKLMSGRYIPTWAVSIIDTFIVIVSTWISVVIMGWDYQYLDLSLSPYLQRFFLLSICCTIIALFAFRIHRSVIRYSTFNDMIRIFFAVLSTAIIILLISFFYKLNYNQEFLPYTLIIVNAIISYTCLFSFRMFVRWIFEKAFKISGYSGSRINVVIFGAGRTGIATANTLISANRKHYINGFIDDDPYLQNKTVMGQKIYSRSEQERILKSNEINQLIIATNRISTERKNEIFELCHANGVKVLTVPPIKTWTDGKLKNDQIKEIQLEDLLGRAEITINRDLIEQQISGKTILISGAAGSIGSEIVRQLARFSVRLVLLDQAETPMYHIENELNDKFPSVGKDIVIASVTDQNRLREIFNKYKPQIVFHAAAYKHVPMMEREPYQAANNNIIGTKYIADISMENKVEKFIMISTDKAVNPTNVMGASKRYAEIYIQHLNLLSGNKTKFITTRFGNVLGSNGSVIPRFKEQIRLGGPVTVTHPDITRYFMTIPEASRLVLEAGTMGNGGEIFLFDMGEPVKILSLAERMIKLSGFQPGEQINITFSGLRPGEKLYEELLTKKEDILPTYHKKIYIAKTEVVNSEEIDNCMEELQAILSENTEGQDLNIVRNIKRLVKTFKSNNSVYEELDNTNEK